MKNAQNLVTLRKAAQELGISYNTVYGWARRGEVEFFILGHAKVTTVEELARTAFRLRFTPPRKKTAA